MNSTSRYFLFDRFELFKGRLLLLLLISLSALPSTALPSICLAEAPDSFGPAPSISLTDSNGRKFNSSSLTGKIWVANFFFTRCNGPCPIQTSHLQLLRGKFQDETNLHFVSITVDPKHDSAEVLKKYSLKHAKDDTQWHFLTGELDTIVELMNEGFNLGSGTEPIYHSSRLILVDAAGNIRGFYRGTEMPEIKKLKHRIEALLSEQ